MSEIDATSFHLWIKRIVAFFLVSGLVVLIYLILDPFFSPIAWAVVLAHISWPVHAWLKNRIGNRPIACSLIMVTAMGLLILTPLLWFAFIIQNNIVAGYQSLNQASGAYLSGNSVTLPQAILQIPWLGQELQNWLNTYLGDAKAMNQQLMHWAKEGSGGMVDFLGGVGRNAAKAAFTSVILFVIYRDGEAILRNIKTALYNLFGERIDRYFRTAAEANRAIIFGVILIAITQGIIASIGFMIFNIPNVALLGTLTAIASIIPIVGTFLIWGPVSIWLLINDHPWQALGLFAWGSLLIGAADNLLRPLIISSAMRVSFLLVMFGVFGGIAAFGLIGLILGPIILAIALTAWNEWIQ